MAKGNDSSKDPRRQVGRNAQNPKMVDWDDKEPYPEEHDETVDPWAPEDIEEQNQLRDERLKRGYL